MNLFIIKYVDGDPQFASDYTNTLVRNYIDQNLLSSREDVQGANRFILEQVKDFRGRIQNAEARIAALKEREGIDLVNDEASILMDIQSTQLALDEIALKTEELMAKKDLLNRSSSMDGISPETLNGLENKREKLLLMYTEAFPEVVMVEAEIERVKAQMVLKSRQPQTREPSTESSLIQIEANALGGREAQLRKHLEQSRTRLAALPAKQKLLADLIQERDSFQKTYQDLVARYGQSEVSKQMEIQDKSNSFRIVDPAVVPDKAFSPNRVAIILLSVLGGIGAAIGLIIARDRLDPSVKGMAGIRELGIPILAIIPKLSTRDERSREKRHNMVLAGFVILFLTGVSVLLVMESMNIVEPGAVQNVQEKSAKVSSIHPVTETFARRLP